VQTVVLRVEAAGKEVSKCFHRDSCTHKHSISLSIAFFSKLPSHLIDCAAADGCYLQAEHERASFFCADLADFVACVARLDEERAADFCE